MWTIDSEDWADPIPESIAMRVLHQPAASACKRASFFSYDIQRKQSVLALPLVLDELVQQNYTFLAFDGTGFAPTTPPLGGDLHDGFTRPRPHRFTRQQERSSIHIARVGRSSSGSLIIRSGPS